MRKPLHAAKPPQGVGTSFVRVTVNSSGKVSSELSSFSSLARGTETGDPKVLVAPGFIHLFTP